MFLELIFYKIKDKAFYHSFKYNNFVFILVSLYGTTGNEH